jgi:hypothetical protein
MKFVCGRSDRVAPRTPSLQQTAAVLGILRKSRVNPSEQDKRDRKVKLQNVHGNCQLTAQSGA